MNDQNVRNYVDLEFSLKPEMDVALLGRSCAAKLILDSHRGSKPEDLATLAKSLAADHAKFEAEWRKPLELAGQAHHYRPRILCELPLQDSRSLSVMYFSHAVHRLIAGTPAVDWLIASDYAGRIMEFIRLGSWPKPNALIGLKTRLGERKRDNESIQTLLDTPAAKRALIVDGFYGSVRMDDDKIRRLQWVVCNAQPNAGHVHAGVQYLRNKCAKCGVPFWFEGWKNSNTTRTGMIGNESNCVETTADDLRMFDGALLRGTPFVH